MAKDAIKEPFAVINADDFYGADAYKVIGEYLSQLGESSNHYCMVGYEVNKTLSENGTVSRGVCSIDEDRFLTSIVERTKIERNAEGTIVFHDLGEDEALEENRTCLKLPARTAYMFRRGRSWTGTRSTCPLRAWPIRSRPAMLG